MPHQCTECGRTFADGSKEMLSGCPDCGGNKFQFTPASNVEETSRASDTNPSPTQSTSGSAQPNSGAAADDGRTEWPTHGDEPEAAQRSKPVSPTEADDYQRSSLTSETSEADASSSTSTDGSTDPTTEPTPDRETSEFVDSDSPGISEDSAQASARSDVVSRDELSVANRDSEQPSDEREAAPPETVGDADGPDPLETAPGADGPDPPETDHLPAADHERPELDDLREELNDQFESIRIVSPGKYELNLMELYDRQEYIISLQEDGRYVIEMPNSIDDRGE